MSTEELLTAIGVIISIIGLIIVYVEGIIKTRERLTKIEVKVDVFWRNVSIDAANILHTPHPENARRDYLIEQFVDDIITLEELKELIKVLQTIIENKSSVFGERMAASILLRTIESKFEIKLK